MASWAADGGVDMGDGFDDMLCGNCTEDDDELFKQHKCIGCKDWLCMSNEADEHELIKPHTLAAPSPPSKQEAQEHSVTHIPMVSLLR